MRQVREHRVHLRVRGAIDQIAAVALLRHKAGMNELLQVERQGRRRDAEFGAERAGRQAKRPGDNEGAKHAQPARLGQRRQRLDHAVFRQSG